MRIVMAGSSGFLGTHLSRELAADGHEVVRLVRRPPGGPGEVRWDPAGGQLDPDVLAGAGAVVNLAGANIGDHRWTDRYKAVLRLSRVEPTETIARTIAGLPADARPATLMNASGIDYYGDTGDTAVDENGPAGDGFMPHLARVWEAATGPAEKAGTRVVLLRTSPLLDPVGGMLKPQMLPFKLGIGGKFGSGRQWVAWIALRDWLGAARLLLERSDVAGPVNMTSPNPVTNAEFTRAFGRAVHRPAVLPLPAFALKIVAGELAGISMISHRVVPAVLERIGFRFRYPDLDTAFRAALAESPAA